MYKSRISSRQPIGSKALIAGAAAATLCISASTGFASYVTSAPGGALAYFADDFPQTAVAGATGLSASNDAFSTAVYTYSGSGTPNPQTGPPNAVSATENPPVLSGDPDYVTDSSSEYAYFFNIEGSSSITVLPGATVAITTNSNADLGNFQPNTTYVLNFDVGLRTGYAWTQGSDVASITANILDTTNLTTVATDNITQGNMDNGGSGTEPNWYLESLTFTTGASGSPSVGDSMALQFVANFDGLGGNSTQLWMANVYFTATPTPEPASLGLLGMGTIGVLLRRRRRRMS